MSFEPSGMIAILKSLAEAQQRTDILGAEMKAELAALDAAVLRGDAEAVENVRVRLHNLVDSTIDHKWSLSKTIENFKKDAF